MPVGALSAPVLDRRTLNRTLLARQLLLEPADIGPVALAEHLVGMQAQVPIDPYIGCRARLRGFDPEQLGRAMLERDAVRMTLLRATLHLVSRADAQALRPLLQETLERAFRSSPFARRLSGVDLTPVLTRGAELVEQQPRSLAQLRPVLGSEWPDADSEALAQAVRYLVPLVQTTPRGVWGMSGQATFTTLRAWLGEDGGGHVLEDCVLRYLRAFGPASAADVGTWSGLRDLRPVMERLAPQLRSYRDAGGRELFDVTDGVITDGATPAPVRFLGEFDNVFLSHADRGRIMAGVRWDTSFAHRGSFLVDGFIAGAWKLKRTGRVATLTLDARTRLRAADRRSVRDEAADLLAFLAPDAAERRVS